MRGLNKKGETSQSFIIGMLIALGVLVVAGTVLYTTYRNVDRLGDLLPQELTNFKFACEGYANSNTVTEYCNVFRPAKFTKGESYVNCEYSEIQSVLEDSAKITCDKNLDLAWCKSLSLREGRDVSKVNVNGKACGSLGYAFEVLEESSDTPPSSP